MLSIQERLTCPGETAVAVNELGAWTGAAKSTDAASPETRIAVKIVLRVRPGSLNLPYRLSRVEKFLTGTRLRFWELGEIGIQNNSSKSKMELRL